MMRLLRTTGMFGLVLGLMLLPMGCSGSQGETTSELPPLPSPGDPMYAPPVEISFATDSDGRTEVSGWLEGYGSEGKGRNPPSSVNLRMPAQIDGAQAHLELTIHLDEMTEVLDRSGEVVPRSEQEGAFDSWRAWTATVQVEEPQRRLYALELRPLKRPDSTLAPPVVTGLLTRRPDGLVGVPGEPSRVDGSGERLVEMWQEVSFDGGWAIALCRLTVDDQSKVVTTPRREGSTEELLEWAEEFQAIEYRWQATTRLEEDGTLTLVKLVGTAPPGS